MGVLTRAQAKKQLTRELLLDEACKLARILHNSRKLSESDKGNKRKHISDFLAAHKRLTEVNIALTIINKSPNLEEWNLYYELSYRINESKYTMDSTGKKEVFLSILKELATPNGIKLVKFEYLYHTLIEQLYKLIA
jgi:hypothetical protein